MAKLSITAAWNETVEFVKREARLLFPIAFMLIALPIALLEAFAPRPPGPGELPGPGAWLLLLPLVLLGLIVGNLAISYLAVRTGVSVGEAIGRGTRRFLSLFGAVLLLSLAGAALFFILATVAMVLTPGAMSEAAAGQQGPALALAVTLTLLLMLPFLIYFAARLVLVTPVAAAEEAGPVAIIRRSWSLTAGQVGKFAAFVVLINILVLVLTSAIESVAGILFALLAGPPRPGSTSALMTILVMAAVNTVVVTYLTSLIARIYAQRAAGTTSGS